MKSIRLTLLAAILGLAVAAAPAQNCPKVTYTANTPATIKSLVEAVNCLSEAEQNAAPKTAPAKDSMSADMFKIVGPQHSRSYPGLVLAILTVNSSGGLKTAIVTLENREANVTAEAGGNCSVKINPDKYKSEVAPTGQMAPIWPGLPSLQH
jgi:hypothetical protein